MKKFLIGIGIPYIAIIALLPWVNAIDIFIFGIPFIYMWMFVWFVLTSVCLLSCWLLFDRHIIATDAQDI